jgi:DNA repair protein RadC
VHVPKALGGSTVRKTTWRSGPAEFSDAELLAVLLTGGHREQSALRTAEALLEFAGSLTALRHLGPHLLSGQPGVGQAKGARLLAALELGRRLSLADNLPLASFNMRSFDAVVAWARPRLGPLDHEEVWTLALDGINHLLHARCVARGGQHGCALRARDVLRAALRDGASGLVLVHNHPSGDPQPSVEDVNMTVALAQACITVGLPLLDHVIVARKGASSLFELGVLGMFAA